MNRKEFLKRVPLLGAALLVPGSTFGSSKPERIVEHIHVVGDNLTVRDTTITSNGEQPGISVERPVKLYGPGGEVVYVGRMSHATATSTR